MLQSQASVLEDRHCNIQIHNLVALRTLTNCAVLTGDEASCVLLAPFTEGLLTPEQSKCSLRSTLQHPDPQLGGALDS